MEIDDSGMTRARLDGLVEGFRAHAADLCREAQDPILSQDMCEHWSSVFADWLATQGVDARTFVCEGYRGEFPRHSWDHRVDFSEYWHVVARVGGWHVDWSHRQFDTTAAVPMIAVAAEDAARWKLCMDRDEFERMEELAQIEFEKARSGAEAYRVAA